MLLRRRVLVRHHVLAQHARDAADVFEGAAHPLAWAREAVRRHLVEADRRGTAAGVGARAGAFRAGAGVGGYVPAQQALLAARGDVCVQDGKG